MFSNLKAEMARLNINIKKLSDITGIAYQTLNSKCNGRTEFTLRDCRKIKKALGDNLTLDYLFERDV